MKKVEDHPVEDIFGDEICQYGVYWVFGQDVVSEENLKRYLIENQQVDCFQAR